MASARKQKARICQVLLQRNQRRRLEALAWDQMAPVGREFGSPDFDRLLEHDYRTGAGVFDPKLQVLFAQLDTNERLPAQRFRRG